MILGLGTDIIEIKRIRNAILRYHERFLMRHFTEQEQLYCKTYQDLAPHLAGRFAAKEAIVKALGTGFRPGITWLDISILNNALGKPEVLLSESIHQLWTHPIEMLLSISHCKEYACATAIAVKKTPINYV